MLGLFKRTNSIQSEILSDLQSAKKSIKVAVSWLTDTSLIQELIKKRRQGLDVKILVSANELNVIRFELFREIQHLGGFVQKWGNEETSEGGFMHFKFYIIDDSFAKSGSYNWSINATSNAEALDKVDVFKKIKEFQAYFSESVDFFAAISNPERKRDELELIRKEKHQDVLTPEILQAYRNTQKAFQQHEEKIRLENERIDRVRQDLARQQEQLKTVQERMAREEAERREKEKNAQYAPKKDVKEVVLPPTSYANG
ncbi:MAG TPA: phospholipase D-like domain-containing protein [Saprospiraceae bacterium]|nr:phospholipase D-like domain-containing protein [Saprospiraceae bacterium]